MCGVREGIDFCGVPVIERSARSRSPHFAYPHKTITRFVGPQTRSVQDDNSSMIRRAVKSLSPEGWVHCFPRSENPDLGHPCPCGLVLCEKVTRATLLADRGQP